MDLSKLPRLSDSSKDQPPPAPAEQGQPPTSVSPNPSNYPQRVVISAEPVGTTGDAWISIAVGLIILLLSPKLFQYILSPSTFGTKWTFLDVNGNPTTYPHTIFFWGDLCLYLFAFTLLAEGLILGFARKATPIAIGFGLTCLATAANAIYLVAMVAENYGFQLFSALAVAFGVYIAMYQWNLLKAFAAARTSR